MDPQPYLAPLGTFLAVLAGIIAVKRLALRRLLDLAKRTETDWDDALLALLWQVRTWELGLVAFFLATRGLPFPPYIHRSLRVFLVLVVVYRAIRVLQGLAAHLLSKFDLGISPAAARNASYMVSVLIWVGGGLVALANLGVNITAMLAGLGVGGIAIALAAQAVLADLFSAVAIFLDKPFVVGDAIQIDSFLGTVERIGIKTTRVRSITGELIVFPNSSLTSAKIRNYQQLWERRVLIGFRVPFQTDLGQVKQVPRIVKEIIEKTPKVRLDRSHFKGFGDSSLEFEAVFYVLDADYNKVMDVSEEVHFNILDAFQKNGLRFATPTHTLIHEGGKGA